MKFIIQQKYDICVLTIVVCFLYVVLLGMTYIYVSSEHTFYSWDLANYHNITRTLVSQFQASPDAAVDSISRSLSYDYNSLFAVPLLPFVLILGKSRLMFELTLVSVYLAPLILVIATMGSWLTLKYSRGLFVATLLVSILTPMLWIPTLRGFPDAASATLIGLAVLAYWADTEIKQKWQIPLIAFLLASSVLIRRHFAYSAIAFLISVSIQPLLDYLSLMPRVGVPASQRLSQPILRVLQITLYFGLILLLLGRPFVERVLSTNFSALYASSAQPVSVVVPWYAETYGWGTCILAAIGFAVGLKFQTVQRNRTLFVLTFGCISFALWLLFARQLGPHFTLHFTPAIIFGNAILLWTVWLKSRLEFRLVLITLICLYLVANMIVGITPTEFPSNSSVRVMFASKWPPLIREDYTELVRLVDRLRSMANQHDPIYVVGSSEILNSSLILNVEREIYGSDKSRLNVLPTADMDSRDFFPIEELLEAKYVILPQPRQSQSRLGQGIQQGVDQLFNENSLLHNDFERLPDRFKLAGGVRAEVLKRSHASSAKAAAQALLILQSNATVYPGQQRAWIPVIQNGIVSIERNSDSSYTLHVKLSPSPEGSSTTLLYAGDLEGEMLLSGTIRVTQEHCPAVAINVATLDVHGNTLDIGDVLVDGNRPVPLMFELPKSSGRSLLLVSPEVAVKLKVYCSIHLERIKIQSIDDSNQIVFDPLSFYRAVQHLYFEFVENTRHEK